MQLKDNYNALQLSPDEFKHLERATKFLADMINDTGEEDYVEKLNEFLETCDVKVVVGALLHVCAMNVFAIHKIMEKYPIEI
jgi:hypothetical protein